VDHWEGNCSLSTLTSWPLFSRITKGKERKKERNLFLVDFFGGIYSENKHISPKKCCKFQRQNHCFCLLSVLGCIAEVTIMLCVHGQSNFFFWWQEIFSKH
jgi:hypothetical protein